MIQQTQKSKILMIALEFPPCESAGVQRVFQFSKNLVEYDWDIKVLCGKSYLCHKENKNNPGPIEDKNVIRAHGLDVRKHLSYKGKYLESLCLPDRFGFWFFHAVIKGYIEIKKNNINVIWSTYPVATSHLIAFFLKKFTGVNWIADYRDPAPFHYVEDKKYNFLHKWVDKKTISTADKIVFVTENMRALYLQKYMGLSKKTTTVIENGYTKLPESFDYQRKEKKGIIFLHSGTLYSNGRSPDNLLKAVKLLEEKIPNAMPHIVFRGVDYNVSDAELIKKLEIEQYVSMLPSVSFQESIDEMMQSEVLVIIQGALFKNQIPGKVYEYLATRKLIFVITSSDSATGEKLKDVSGVVVSLYDDINDIYEKMLYLINNFSKLNDEAKQRDVVSESRLARSKELAELLSEFKNK